MNDIKVSVHKPRSDQSVASGEGYDWKAAEQRQAKRTQCDDGYPTCRVAEAKGRWCEGVCQAKGVVEQSVTADFDDSLDIPF